VGEVGPDLGLLGTQGLELPGDGGDFCLLGTGQLHHIRLRGLTGGEGRQKARPFRVPGPRFSGAGIRRLARHEGLL
jgi:hypothetical protein